MANVFAKGIIKTANFATKQTMQNGKVKDFVKGGDSPYKVTNEQLREYARNLLHDTGWNKEGMKSLIEAGRTRELKYIIAYLKSDRAVDISKWDRATLIHEAAQKLDVLKIFSDLMH